jgi:TolA-binding protein
MSGCTLSIRWRRAARAALCAAGVALAWPGAPRARADTAAAPPPPAASAPAEASAAAPSAAVAEARGRRAMEDGLHALAERQFRAALAQAASGEARAAASVWLARALMAQGRAGEAGELLRPLAAAPGGGAEDVTFWLARAQYEQGEAVAALATLGPESEAGDEAHAALRARALARAGETGRALDAFASYAARFPDSPMKPALMMEHAELLRARDRPEEAAAVLDRLLIDHPQDPQTVAAKLLLGRVRMDTGAWSEAEQLLRELADDALKAPADRVQAMLLLASGYEARAQADEAVRVLERGTALAEATRWAPALQLSRARLLIAGGAMEEGRLRLREVAAADARGPRVAETQLFLAQQLLDRGAYAAAADEFRFYVETFENPPGEVEARIGRGWALRELRRHAEAAVEFERAAAVQTDPAERRATRMKAADAQYAAQAYEAARALYQPIAGDAAAPEAAEAAYLAADCLRHLKQTDAALAEFEAFERDRPEHSLAVRAIFRQAGLHESAQAWDRALACYSRVLDRAGISPAQAARARLGRGLIRYRGGAFAEARAEFDDVVAQAIEGPEAEQAFFLRGWCAFLAGHDEEARAICLAFMERYPASEFAPDVQFWLAEHAFNRGDWVAAEDGFSTLPARFPASRLAPEGLYWSGRAAMSAREYVRALDYFGRLVRDYPGHARLPDARYAQGDALSELGRFPEAILAFDEVVKGAPDTVLADLAWGRKGDCHFALGADDAKRFAAALQAFKTVRDQPRATMDVRMQAEFKMGRCEERLGRIDEAMEHYMNVLYAHVEERARGRPGAPMWFARAGFSGAGLLERREQWREAVGVYRRLVEDGGAAAAEAEARMQRIRTERWTWF